MKKRILAGVLGLTLLAGIVTLAGAASQDRALVSLSYLNGAFWSDLKAVVKQEVDRDTSAIYSAAAGQVGQGGGTAGSFTPQSGVKGDVVTGGIGCGLVWTQGSALLRSGALVDATAGTEVAASGALTIGHRYLAGTDVTLVVSSNAAQWMAEGSWTVTAGEPLPAQLPFIDVSRSAWYYEDVSYVYQRELFNGSSPTQFAPEDKMQRCMMTTVLHRLAGKPAGEYSAVFRDIPDGQWYTEGTVWAGRTGVVSGVGDELFDPFSNVTRQQIAVILYNYAVRMGYDVSVSAELSQFSDVGAVASWGRSAISWAVGAEIINGRDGALAPDGDATRAEVAAMLHRFTIWTGK